MDKLERFLNLLKDNYFSTITKNTGFTDVKSFLIFMFHDYFPSTIAIQKTLGTEVPITNFFSTDRFKELYNNSSPDNKNLLDYFKKMDYKKLRESIEQYDFAKNYNLKELLIRKYRLTQDFYDYEINSFLDQLKGKPTLQKMFKDLEKWDQIKYIEMHPTININNVAYDSLVNIEKVLEKNPLAEQAFKTLYEIPISETSGDYNKFVEKLNEKIIPDPKVEKLIADSSAKTSDDKIIQSEAKGETTIYSFFTESIPNFIKYLFGDTFSFFGVNVFGLLSILGLSYIPYYLVNKFEKYYENKKNVEKSKFQKKFEQNKTEIKKFSKFGGIVSGFVIFFFTYGDKLGYNLIQTFDATNKLMGLNYSSVNVKELLQNVLGILKVPETFFLNIYDLFNGFLKILYTSVTSLKPIDDIPKILGIKNIFDIAKDYVNSITETLYEPFYKILGVELTQIIIRLFFYVGLATAIYYLTKYVYNKYYKKIEIDNNLKIEIDSNDIDNNDKKIEILKKKVVKPKKRIINKNKKKIKKR